MSSADQRPPRPSAFAHLLPSSSLSSLSALAPSPWDGPLQVALSRAVIGVGRTAPNPPVGCVIVDDDGAIVAVGHHEAAGQPHAEVRALDALIAQRGPGSARGLTAVVTLEPCAHTGRTPPCTERLIREGVRRVVVGALDPNPKVDGRGVDGLRAAGIEVIVADGKVAAACTALIAPFATTMTAKRCYVVLKTATTLDGKVATVTGESRFITGPASRRLVHALRDAVDGIVVGASTVVVDDPALTVRDHDRAEGPRRDPLRIVLDRRARVALTARVFDPPGALLVHETTATPKPVVGVSTMAVDGLDLRATCENLASRGVSSVLVEAGPRLAAGMLNAGVVDELWWFTAPLVMGGTGIGAVGDLQVSTLAQAHRFETIAAMPIGDDTLTILRPRR